MENGSDFVNYYDVLQVSVNCDARTLENAYRYLAKRYHPDYAGADAVGKFTELTEAYSVLRDPEKRAEYNRANSIKPDESLNSGPGESDARVDDQSASSDGDAHERILLHLYKRRREHAGDPGVPGWLIQELLGCSDESFDFHAWYLKAKGFIEVTEQGLLAISIQGVDQVISTSRTTLREKLLLAPTDAGDDQP